MSEKKTLTLNGLVLPNFIFILINLGMIIVGAYLTNHYMDTHFPSGLQQASQFCNINDFWGCDKATNSIFGNVLGVPTALFGLLLGLVGLVGALLGNEAVERNLKLLFAINFAGCILLFLYSLIALGSLCPMCTVYYVLSALGFFMFYRFSSSPMTPDLRVLGIIAVVFLIPSMAMVFHIGSKEKQVVALKQSYITQYNALKDYGEPTLESPYKIHMATADFNSAPIRISIFSDFQCPYCKLAADQSADIVKDFGEHVNIQYFFYPLDSTCNTAMKGSMHPYACQAAFLAACDEEKFSEIHDYIFANQEEINFDNLKKWQEKYGLSGCFDKQELKDRVQQTLNAGEQFKLKSTPTIIVNGRKLEGLIPYPHLKGILESLIK